MRGFQVHPNSTGRRKWCFLGSVLHEQRRSSTELDESVTRLETSIMKKVKFVRSDRGSEIQKKELQDYFNAKGIANQTTATYLPESNGKAERLNRTLIEDARAILQDLHEVNADFEDYKCVWAEAVTVMNYVMNRCLTR